MRSVCHHDRTLAPSPITNLSLFLFSFSLMLFDSLFFFSLSLWFSHFKFKFQTSNPPSMRQASSPLMKDSAWDWQWRASAKDTHLPNISFPGNLAEVKWPQTMQCNTHTHIHQRNPRIIHERLKLTLISSAQFHHMHSRMKPPLPFSFLQTLKNVKSGDKIESHMFHH